MGGEAVFACKDACVYLCEGTCVLVGDGNGGVLRACVASARWTPHTPPTTTPTAPIPLLTQTTHSTSPPLHACCLQETGKDLGVQGSLATEISSFLQSEYGIGAGHVEVVKRPGR